MSAKRTGTKDVTVGSGNTKARSFLLTIFEDTLKDDDLAIYMTACEDTCKDGKHHFHQLLHYKNPVSFNRIKRIYPTAHIERPRSLMNAMNYIQKNANGRKFNVIERGERPHQGVAKTIGELREIKDMNELDWRQYKTWKQIQDEQACVIDIDDWKKDVEVYYIQGPSGIGKTEKAKEIVRAKEDHRVEIIKREGDFYHGAAGIAPTAIYDDFRDSHMTASEFINLIDYNKHTMNIKGGSIQNKYNTIIITSVQPLNEIYKNLKDEPRKQWERRVHVIDLYAQSLFENILKTDTIL